MSIENRVNKIEGAKNKATNDSRTLEGINLSNTYPKSEDQKLAKESIRCAKIHRETNLTDTAEYFADLGKDGFGDSL